MARAGHQVIEAQRHAKRHRIEGAHRHAARGEVPQRQRPLHLVQGLLVRWRQLRPPRGQFRVPGAIAPRAGGERVPGGAAQAPQHVTGLLGPVRVARERQAPRLQLLVHGGQERQRLPQLLVPGQQLQHLVHFVVMGRVQNEESEHLGMQEAIALGGGEEEGRALALEEGGGVFAHGTQGAQPHGAPVIQLLHQPGHVHPLLQRDEFGGRGARQKRGEERLPLV
ncbi:hypothetical protein [Archangium sp.]|uniref:hypothetical protein n=1 Tax=Archangium sp. TaxID=1872627 RepID=UPI002D7A0146|nr:hypothetical protein [Archangium sp.]